MTEPKEVGKVGQRTVFLHRVKPTEKQKEMQAMALLGCIKNELDKENEPYGNQIDEVESSKL